MAGMYVALHTSSTGCATSRDTSRSSVIVPRSPAQSIGKGPAAARRDIDVTIDVMEWARSRAYASTVSSAASALSIVSATASAGRDVADCPPPAPRVAAHNAGDCPEIHEEMHAKPLPRPPSSPGCRDEAMFVRRERCTRITASAFPPPAYGRCHRCACAYPRWRENDAHPRGRCTRQ